MTAILVENVQKSFGDFKALRGAAFHVEHGEGVVLLGANGCGKSTLIRCINGLEKVSGGRITVNGIEVTSASRRALRRVRREVGVVFQKFNLVSNLSAFQNVLYGAMGEGGLLNVLGPLACAEKRERAMHCLERVGLAEKAEQKGRELSGGQQQRVAIARMLMQRPKLVLADEPIASLDPKAGRDVMNLLWEVVSEHKLTVICTLHQLDVAMEYGDRILGMKAGRIVLDRSRACYDRKELDALYFDERRAAEVPSSQDTQETESPGVCEPARQAT